MSLPPIFSNRLTVLVMASPLFIVSGPELVIAQWKADVVGAFPALNARPIAVLDEWLTRIDAAHSYGGKVFHDVTTIVQRLHDEYARAVAKFGGKSIAASAAAA